MQKNILPIIKNGVQQRRYAQIIGWGKSLPSKILTNKDLELILDTNDEWIKSRSGINQRHIVGPKESTSTLAIRASKEALKIADISPRSIDLIICATDTPDYLFPATACLIQDALGASKAGAFDIEIGCCGFIYALSIANSYIISGIYQNILVVAAESMSKVIDWSDRSTAVLFGDGAAAVIIQATEKPTGLVSFVLGADGSGADLLIMPGGGSRNPTSIETVENRMHYLKMSGTEVYKFAINAMIKATKEALLKANMTIDEIDLMIPHQANNRIIENAIKSLNIEREKVFLNLEHVGNTSSAAVAIALVEAIESGKIKTGYNIILVAFGAGLSWASAILRWGISPVVPSLPWWKSIQYRYRRLRAKLRSFFKRIRRRIGSLFTLD